MKWIICFCESENIGLWRVFTRNRKGFSHVFAIQYDVDNGTWHSYEFSTQGFRFRHYKDKEADLLFVNMMEHWTCVEINAEDKPIYMPRLMYCVSFVKHILSVNKFWVLTPYQLYCELLKNGGVRMFEKETGDSNG